MSEKINLKTDFSFSAAHRIVGYSGKCNNLHGHTWKVEIEVEGNKKQLDVTGILWDFTNASAIKRLFDHKTILKKCDENMALIQSIDYVSTIHDEDGIYLMRENPTAENLCFEILAHCKTSNPNLKYKVRVWESANSYAEVKK